MHVLYKEKFLKNDERVLSFYKEIRSEVIISCALVFEGEKMIEYQKSLFEDFLSVLVDQLSNDEIGMNQVKKDFEKGLQDTNMKLQVFNEKMGSEGSFPIHGSLQIIFEGDYIASFIGNSGLIILRKGKLNYMLTNAYDELKKVWHFSELVEGEVKLGDSILACGFPVETYLDKEDILTIVGTSHVEDTDLIDGFIDILSVRLSEDQIRFITKIDIESPIEFTKNKLKNRFEGPYKKILDSVGGLENFQSTILYGLLVLIVLLLSYGLIQSFQKANQASYVSKQGNVVVDVTIEDIQRDIGRFQKIDPSSDQKIKKYNEIIGKLDLLDQNDKWSFDVAEFRKILEAEYYKGFNIVLANTDSFFREKLYSFTQQEKNTVGQMKNIFFKDSMMIGGDEGVILGAINDQSRGSVVSAGIDRKFVTCGQNLLGNGLYCATESNELFNIVKSGLLQPVSTDAGVFPSQIAGIGKFASSNMYVLTGDPSRNANRIHIIKYKNKLGSQEQFDAGTEYIVNEGEGSEFIGSGLNSFAIDGTFLVWSAGEKSLHQLWRLPNGGNDLEYRKIELNGGDTVEPYSENTKVIADIDSNYVYLFDKDNASFTVYRSTPYKTNDAYTYSYELSYFFRIKFGLPEMSIHDVFVVEGEKSRLLLLTDDEVYQLPLHEYIDQYFQKES